MSDSASDFAVGGALLGGFERIDGSYLNSLSASSISTLLTCPEKFRLSYLHKKWPRASAATALGHAYHYALQQNLEQKVFSGKDLWIGDLLREYERGWSKALDEDIWWKDDDPEETRQLGAEMLKIYHRMLSPSVKPIAVEERFEVPIPGVDLPLTGRIDTMEEGRILDRKTQKQGATKASPEWRVQGLVYMAAYPRHDVAWHVQAKTGNLRTYGPEKNKGLILYNTPGKQRSAWALVKAAWETLQDLYARYGLERPWPGTALVHPYACFSCSHRSGCVWWT